MSCFLTCTHVQQTDGLLNVCLLSLLGVLIANQEVLMIYFVSEFERIGFNSPRDRIVLPGGSGDFEESILSHMSVYLRYEKYI